METNFEDFFTKEFLEYLFDTDIKYKGGGGRDKLDPMKYWELYSSNLIGVSSKCLNASYEFTPYREKLLLKGREKYPRVISIPTVQDRIVLCALNKYLQKKLILYVYQRKPNDYIIDLIRFLKDHEEENIFFFKGDIQGFYDNIDHDVLVNQLKGKGVDSRAIRLLERAIKTPTLADGESKRNDNKKGVPQGLAISNVLASFYMTTFDEEMEKKNSYYLRYVDDFIVLNDNRRAWNKEITSIITDNRLGLSLSEDKIKDGDFNEDSFDFLGYVFEKGVVTVRKQSVNRYIERVARLCTKFKNDLRSKECWPRHIQSQESLVLYYLEKINLLISGFKLKNYQYGWLAYYKGMTDISLLFRLDKIVRKKLLKNILGQFENFELHSFVKTYYDIRERKGAGSVIDLDSCETIDAKKAFLVSQGWLSEDENYADDYIINYFKKCCLKLVRENEKNIGYFN